MFSNKHYVDAVKGVSWLFISTVVSRLVVFSAQIFIGHLLSPKDIGLYAVALSVTNFLGAIRNGGTLQWLVYRGAKYKEYLSDSTQYALLFNFICMIATFVALFFIDEGPDRRTIQILCFVIAISIPISTFGAIYRIELLIQNRFKQSSILSTISTVLWQLEILYAAYNGYGPFSYIVPILLQAIFDGLLGWYFVRSWPITRPVLDSSKFRFFFKDTKLIMLAAFALSLALTGQYFVIGLFASAATVGYFFFGFQNAYNVFILINVATESVLPSVFTKIESKEVQNKTVVDLLKTFNIIICPVIALLILLSPYIFTFIWKDKWMQSVFVFQCTLMAIPALLLISFVKSLHEARGQWRYRFVLMFLYGVGTIVVTAFGALLDNLFLISLLLFIFYFTLGLLIIYHMSGLLEIRFLSLLMVYLMPILVSIVCSLAFILVFSWLSLPVVTKVILSCVAFIIAQLIFNFIIYRDFWVQSLRKLF